MEKSEDYIESGYAFINDNKTTDPNYYISQGDYIEIMSSTIEQPTPPELEIIFQDEKICVINKRAGFHSVDSIRGATWPMEDVLRWNLSQKKNPNPFVAAVHRLDVDTSGILVIAIKNEAASFLGKALEKRMTEKIYHAVVSPLPAAEKFSITEPIGYDTSQPGKWICNGKNPREAITSFEIIKKTSEKALLKCIPLTGRTHQIRVHLKHNNTPIVGDSIYDGEKHSRLLLHCSHMNFPDLELDYSFDAELPVDFDFL